MKRTGTEESLEEEQPRTKRFSTAAVRKFAYADAGSEDEDDPENQVNSSGEDVAPRRKAVPAPLSKRGKGAAAAAAAAAAASSSSSSRGKKKSRPVEEDDDDQDDEEEDEAAAAGGNDDDDDDEDFAPAPKKRATTKRAAAKRSAAAMDDDDDDEDFDDEGEGNRASHSAGLTQYDDDDEDDVLEDEDGVPCDYEVGQIAMIEVENFMNHRKFSMPFCRNVNFITGRNGSGKSAIATALMLCLGSRAAATGRSTNLSKLIREGSPGPAVLKGECEKW